MESAGINLTGANAPVFVKAFGAGADTGVPLRPGDIIQARVTAFSQGSAVLRFGALKIPVSTQLSLNPGDVLSLLVVELKPERVVLKRLDTPGMTISPAKYGKEEVAILLLRNAGFSGNELSRAVGLLTAGGIDTGRGLADLIKTLTQLKSDGKTQIDVEHLLSSVRSLLIENGDDTGTIEAKIKAFIKTIDSEAELLRYLEDNGGDIDNLKSALLEARATLQHSIATERSGLLSGLRTSLEKVLDLVNASKAINLPIEPQAREMIYIPLPIRVGDELRTAELRIYADDDGDEKKAGRGSGFTVGFALEMPSLGKTRAFLETRERTVNFSISFENGDALIDIDNQLQEFKKALEGLGYSVGRLSAGELTPDETTGSLIEEKAGIKPTGIDVRV